MKRMMLCSNALKLSENAPDARDPRPKSISETCVGSATMLIADSRGLQLDESLFAPSNRADAFTRRATVENPLSEVDCACCTKKARMVGDPPLTSSSPCGGEYGVGDRSVNAHGEHDQRSRSRNPRSAAARASLS